MEGSSYIYFASVEGVEYFECRDKHGAFVRPSCVEKLFGKDAEEDDLFEEL